MSTWPMPSKAQVAAIMVLGLFPGPGPAADVAYGEYLAQECVTCHRGHVNEGTAIPAIAGRPATDLIKALHEFRTGRRANPVMQNVARSLDDQQIEALAAYFASIVEEQP